MTARPTMSVLTPGLSTSVQDVGRPGWQRFGVPVSGALDRVALAAANVVVGNRPDEAGLECLYQGPLLEVAADSVRMAVAGAGAALSVAERGDGAAWRPVRPCESVRLARGARVRVVLSGPSISAYLAIEGGISVPLVMGSRSTFARAGLGGLDGRVLRKGDAVPLTLDTCAERQEARLPDLDLATAETVRVVLGPQADRFTDATLVQLTAAVFVVEPASDRMGLRLAGPRLEHTRGADIISDGIAAGAIQVPGSGRPIIMLADRQTTGGYTKIATVISADLPALGRVGPGTALRFSSIAVAEAERLRRGLDAGIAAWPRRLVPALASGPDLSRLYDRNLISGVVDADG